MSWASDELRVSRWCRALAVSRSGDDDWLHRPPSLHAQRDQGLSQRIGEHVEADRPLCATRRLKDCLADEGQRVSRRRMGRLMAEQDLEVFDNRQRRHWAHGNLAPMVYEKTQQAA